MELNVIFLTPTKGGKPVILLHYITLVPHKSLMHHDSQIIILYHNFHLFFPIWDREDFEKLRKFLLFLKIPPLMEEI